MAQPTSGMSQPSVSTMQLETSSVSPEASRAKMASRSSSGVPPSRCSARTPERTNSSQRCRLWATLQANATGLPALAELVPMRDDVADQFRVIHPGGEFVLDIVTVADMDAAQVRRDRRVDSGLNQPVLPDEVWDLRALDHGGEDPAESAAVAATR